MSAEKQYCAVEQANDTSVMNEVYSCTSCSVRAFQNPDGIIEMITRNVCQRMVIGVAASSPETYAQLMQTQTSDFAI